jgi:hypothetical protein
MDAVDIVRNAGFKAIEAANADQAIAIIELPILIFTSSSRMCRCPAQWTA